MKQSSDRPTPAERARRAAVRERARRAEERRAIIREAMSLIGSATTPAKRRAARKNGKQGGRPRLSPGANTKAPPNAAGQGRREAPYPEPDGSAFDSEEPDDREERCDSCGETSRCLMNGLCPMCYELNGGTHD